MLMKKRLYITLAIVLALLSPCWVMSQDNTNILRHSINYHVDSVDMWGGGAATFIDFDYSLIDLCVGGECEGSDFPIHQMFGTDALGIAFDFDLYMYLNSTFSMHGFSSGYIGVDYPVQITLDFPDHYGFDHGETTPIHSTYTVQNGWALDTHFPTAGTIALDLEYGFGVDMSVSVEVLGSTVVEVPLIPHIGYPINPQFSSPVPHDSIAVLYLNAQTGEYAYPWIDEDTGMPYINTGMFGTGDSLVIHIPDAFGIGITADITIPYVETEDRIDGQCLYAEGQDDWFYMHWNLLQFIRFIGNAVGQPEIGQIVDILEGQTIEYPIYEDYVITIEYYILHATLQMTMALVQEFSFCPDIMATLRFATPLPFSEREVGGTVVQEGESDNITFKVNNDLYITYPCYGWDSLQVYDVTYNIHSGFVNHTYNNLRLALDLQVLHIAISIPGFDGGLFSVVTVPEFQLPEIEGGYEIADDAVASSYEIAGIDVERYNEEPRTRDRNSRFDICIPTDCGALIDQSFDLFDVDLDFLGLEREWDLRFPDNQYNVTFPGTWLHPRPELDIDVSSSNVICYGDNSGVITVTAINGAPNYTWQYSEGTTNTHAGPTDEINVYSGYYYITLSDTYGCTVAGEANILEANSPLESITRADDVLCHGESTGNLYVTVYGGLPPYQYLWSNGSTQQNPQGVPAGTYTVTVTDAVGCEHEDQVVVDEPDAPLEITDVYIMNVSCFGMRDGSINITVEGGTPAYTYYWSNGYTVQDLHNIGAGAYTVTITDANGCFVISTYVVEQPEPLTLNIDARDVRCYAENSGSIDLTVTGGTEPYSYQWSNGEVTEDLSDLYAGFYIVTVTDAHGCVEYAMAQIHQPALPLHGDITPTDVRCYGEGNGVCDLNVFGGTPPYYYTWNTGAISEDIDNLVPGLYSVTITDENGCLAYDTAHIYQSEFPLSGQISGRDASCYGLSDGNVMFTADGGYEPYHYEWSNGLWQQNLVGVPAGTYTVTLTDANFCHREYTYVVGQPEPFYIQMMDDFTVCHGMPTQIGIGIVSGGVPPYTILWSNGESGMSTEVAPTQTTTYYASVVDATNCSSAEMSVTVSVLDPITLDVVLLSDTLVCPGTRSEFDISVTGGGITIDDLYVNGEPLKMPFEPIVDFDTVFNFVAYDSCRYDSVVIPISIRTYEEVPMNISADVVEGCAPLRVSFSENTPDVGQSYLWNFDDGDFENMSFAKNPKHIFYNSGLFNVKLEVTSYQGCKRDTSIAITVFSIPEADFRVDRANISMSSPIVNFTNYSHGGFWNMWNFGDNTTSSSSSPVHTYTMPGTYHVVLTTTSLYGCTDTAGVDIQVSNEYNIFAPTAFTPNNDEINETFRLFGTSIDPNSYMLIIYDRWGAVQFKSTNLEEEWDGTDGTRPCPEGVYTWRAYFKDMFGIDYEKTGTVMLLR